MASPPIRVRTGLSGSSDDGRRTTFNPIHSIDPRTQLSTFERKVRPPMATAPTINRNWIAAEFSKGIEASRR